MITIFIYLLLVTLLVTDKAQCCLTFVIVWELASQHDVAISNNLSKSNLKLFRSVKYFTLQVNQQYYCCFYQMYTADGYNVGCILTVTALNIEFISISTINKCSWKRGKTLKNNAKLERED